jgi:7-carboxy-7-deazaguanine synthase
MTQGHVTEIFSTLQGEGPHVGQPQIFIRLAGCPWRCNYCDTPGSLGVAGAKQMSVEDVLDEVHHCLEKREQSWVSVTGGEPLSQAGFLTELLPALRRLRLKNYLETSGTDFKALERVVEFCDVVAMDVKLPSAIGKTLWSEHEKFLDLAGDKAFAKVILTEATTDDEIQKALALLARRKPAPLLVLQPVTPIEDLASRLKKSGAAAQIQPPPPEKTAGWFVAARKMLPQVMLQPQMHPIWGLP